MNPIEITKQLQDTLVNYLTTTFDVNRDGHESILAQELQESFALDGALFNGPYLEINLPYITGVTLEQLTREGILSPKLLQLDCFKEGDPIPPAAPLYLHQESSIRQLLSENMNIVISSGTGSGKTECFLIPILNDLLLDPTPGVRAVIIYPMNALVNDQLDRLRTLLRGTSITFGRYTGELEQTRQEALRNRSQEPLPNEIICRDDIQKEGKLPQILITNYAMLEYLLLRPEDAPLFQQGLWKYLVLDEAHTYAGAQGIEVGLLIRRLKHRLKFQRDTMRCIATSATLTSDSAEEAAEFAENLFGEKFTEQNVIFGDIDPDYVPDSKHQFSIPTQNYLHPDFHQLLEEIRKPDGQTENIALRMAEMGLISSEMLDLAKGQEPSRFLWEVLIQCNDVNNLRRLLVDNPSPTSVLNVAEQFFDGKFSETSEKLQALYHLIELGAMARPEPNKPSLLPAKYHLFARPPHGIWVCVNPKCPGKQNQETGWSRIFASKRETCDLCGCSVYPLTICRTCGQTYLRMMEENGKYLPEVTDIFTVPAKRYLTWSPIYENRALVEIDDEEEIVASDETATIFDQEERNICLRCNSNIASCSCGARAIPVSLQMVMKQEKSRSNKPKPVPLSFMNECPRCHDREFNDEEIAREVSMATTNPLSIVTSELYRLLPEGTQEGAKGKPGNGRKLLTFYDSRQGAARFAAFLSDLVNQEVYRNLIPASASNLYDRNKYWPDAREVSLECVRLGWEAHIFHNDPETGIPQTAKKLSSPQQNQLAEFVQKQLIAEFTTRRRVRRSLESIGLVGIQYFEANNVPDFSKLAQKIALTPVQTKTLVEYLLDGLRNAKIITLPDGVNFDDEIFGRNKFHPAIIREGKPSKYEVAWIGSTERQMRRRLIQKVLKTNGLPSHEEQVVMTLNHIWEWLIDKETDLMAGTPASGYRLRHDRIFFETHLDWYRCNQCRRISCRGNALVCPHPYCDGQLERIELDSIQNYNYYHRVTKKSLIPMRIEEHTAQLDQDKGRSYQDAFKAGDVNVLSCSTTFEMGIDLGDLQAIVLSNIPPTVANYKQRAGRAGRRTSGAAFVLAWASERPHDQTFFNRPVDIIGGQVRVPHILLENPLITQRHVNAIIISAFFRHLKREGYSDLRKVGPFFESSVNGAPHIVILDQWLLREKEAIRELLQDFWTLLSLDYCDIDQWIDQFKSDIHQKAGEPFNGLVSSYKSDLEKAHRSYADSNFSSKMDLEIIKTIDGLLKRIREDQLINYLSDQGVLPSYSFPLHTVYLQVPNSSGLRLQRDLRQAIREYAPGQEVVADKRLWRSAGIDFRGKSPRVYQYKICEVCNHLQVATGAELNLPDPYGPCPVCKNKPSKRHRDVSYFLQPDGFKTDGKLGKPAGQYVARQPNLMRSALLPGENVDWQQLGELIQFSYDRRGTLLYVNEGMYGSGFKICMNCGLDLGKNVKKCTNKINGQTCGGTPRKLNLGFQNSTDTLHIRFKEASDLPLHEASDTSFWLSLLYALIQGASRALQIERRDIDGVLFPREYGESWQQTIVLYDNVPGGAGHVKRIWEEIEKVIDQALLITNCLDCAPQTSCYHCLQDFNNQLYHSQLNRGSAARFLEKVKISLTQVEEPILGANLVVAVDNSRWLMQQVAQAQQELIIVADEITLRKPVGERKNWLDVLNDLLLSGCKVILYLQAPPQPSIKQPESLFVCNNLRLLIEKGLKVFQVMERPEWNIFIDPKSSMGRAIQIPRSNSGSLNDQIGMEKIVTTINSRSVELLNDTFSPNRPKPVTANDLQLPPSVYILEIENNSAEAPYTEEKVFGNLFEESIEELFINDRYLYDEERLCNRVGAYIRLANNHNTLKKVVIHTWLAGEGSLSRNSKSEQDHAINRLKQLFPHVMIQVKRSRDTSHDRFIIITRSDRTKARILIGQGLDFIKPDGGVKPTYITVEDPYDE